MKKKRVNKAVGSSCCSVFVFNNHIMSPLFNFNKSISLFSQMVILSALFVLFL